MSEQVVSPIRINLKLLDGTEKAFTFIPPTNADMRIAAIMKDFLVQRCVAFQLEEKMLVIPMHQIKSLEFLPTIERAPIGVFANCTEIY